MKDIANKNLESWTNALLQKDSSVMAGFYSNTNLSFLPTLDSRHVLNLEDTQDYFENHFLPKSPKCVEVSEEIVVSLSESSYCHTGKYIFEVGPEDDRRTAEARFTYVWKKEGEDWKILHHHSSLLPV